MYSVVEKDSFLTEFLELAKTRNLSAEECDMLRDLYRRHLRGVQFAALIANASAYIAMISALISQLLRVIPGG